MTKTWGISILGLFLLASNAYANPKVHLCKYDSSVTISWEKGGVISKSKLVSSISDEKKNSYSVSIVDDGKKVFLKGNIGESELLKLSDSIFVEKSQSGNIFLWTIIPGKNEIPTVLYQQKSLEIAGPFATTVAFICQ